MKKVFRMMGLVALVAIAATSCKKEAQTTSTLKATLTQPTSDAKTHLDGSNLVWNEGDAIKVFDNQDEEYLFTTTDAGQATANFTSTASVVVEGSKAFYPAANAVKDGNYVRLNLANSQDYAANSFANGTYPMSAAYATEGFTFSSPCGLLAIPVTGSGSIGSIELTGKNGENLAGDLKFSLANGSYQNVILNGQTTVTLNCGGGVGLDTENATVFYFALPAGVFTGGFTAVLKDVMGNELRTLSTTNDNHIEAQMIRAMPAVTVGNTNVQIVQETATASTTEPTQCTLTGTVTYTGTVDAVGFYYGLSAKGTKDLPGMTKVTLATVPASGEQFEYVLTGLQESTSYQYCIYVKTGEQETYGTVESFTTNAYNPLAVPLTLEALTAGTIVVNSPRSGMKYTLNDGEKQAVTSTAINVAVGDKVRFYGDGTNITSYYVTTTDLTSIAGGTAQVKAYGNIMSLVDETGYATATTLTGTNNFNSLFYQNTTLTNASGLLLPATTLTYRCYFAMFEECNNLTAAPALPATTMANECYRQLFWQCSSLAAAPELPATNLASNCYQGMFHGCTSLTTAPVLSATNLASACYGMMFENCTNLSTAPALPATNLASNCYRQMFNGCSNLNSITCLATSGINENNSTTNWVSGVAATGTFTRDASATWPEGNNGIPAGWTVTTPAWDGNLSLLTGSEPAGYATATNGMTIYGTLGVNSVKVSIAEGANVTLQNATIDGGGFYSYNYAGLTLLGNANITLVGNSTISGGTDKAGIYVPNNKTLTICGNGTVNSTGGQYGAGIGGNKQDPSGNIVITDGTGTINATGGYAGAGIGGGYKGDNGTIEISNTFAGTVNATGNYGSAGIGSGNRGTCGSITINGGTVNATGANGGAVGDGAPGIGSGIDGSCGAITINDGVTLVTATKGSDAPCSIGKGSSASCGTITIGGTNYGTSGVTPNRPDGKTFVYPLPEGVINGLFSVSSTKQVYFSKGSLQYIGSASTPYWKFADNQWDLLSTTNQNTNNTNVDRDIFSWGTSGYAHGASIYQPWGHGTNNNQFYAYGDQANYLSASTGTADWGYNAISNGGNQEHLWYTLNKDEWTYLFSSDRPGSTVNGTDKAHFARATVEGINGVILFPDIYTHPTDVNQPNYINSNSGGWANTYTAADFMKMEAHGAVFLPACGGYVGGNIVNRNGAAFYWSSQPDNNGNALGLYLNNNSINCANSMYRHLGIGVRLVKDAE